MKNRLNTDRPKLKSPSPEPYSREKSLSQDRRAKMISLELEKNTATFNTQHRDLKVSLNSLQSQYDSLSKKYNNVTHENRVFRKQATVNLKSLKEYESQVSYLKQTVTKFEKDQKIRLEYIAKLERMITKKDGKDS